MSTLFIADTHFSHANIIKYCNRPFSHVGEMNAAMIENWNSVVKHGDTVYHLGDFSLGQGAAEPLFDRLNGDIHLVLGNHDEKALALQGRRDGGKRFASVSDLKEIVVEGQKIVLCHYAFRVWNNHLHGSWSLYGHTHGTLPDDPTLLSLDVGVDCWNFFPVTMDQLRKRMSKKKPAARS